MIPREVSTCRILVSEVPPCPGVIWYNLSICQATYSNTQTLGNNHAALMRVWDKLSCNASRLISLRQRPISSIRSARRLSHLHDRFTPMSKDVCMLRSSWLQYGICWRYPIRDPLWLQRGIPWGHLTNGPIDCNFISFWDFEGISVFVVIIVVSLEKPVGRKTGRNEDCGEE